MSVYRKNLLIAVVFSQKHSLKPEMRHSVYLKHRDVFRSSKQCFWWKRYCDKGISLQIDIFQEFFVFTFLYEIKACQSGIWAFDVQRIFTDFFGLASDPPRISSTKLKIAKFEAPSLRASFSGANLQNVKPKHLLQSLNLPLFLRY